MTRIVVDGQTVATVNDEIVKATELLPVAFRSAVEDTGPVEAPPGYWPAVESAIAAAIAAKLGGVIESDDDPIAEDGVVY